MKTLEEGHAVAHVVGCPPLVAETRVVFQTSPSMLVLWCKKQELDTIHRRVRWLFPIIIIPPILRTFL